MNEERQRPMGCLVMLVGVVMCVGASSSGSPFGIFFGLGIVCVGWTMFMWYYRR